MQALGSKIIVRPIPFSQKTLGGIFLTKVIKSNRGEVITIGTAVNKPLGFQINIGDIIYFPAAAGRVFDNSDLLAVKREDVWLKESV